MNVSMIVTHQVRHLPHDEERKITGPECYITLQPLGQDQVFGELNVVVEDFDKYPVGKVLVISSSEVN